MILGLSALFMSQLTMKAQENISYRKPSPEILELVDFERVPSVSMDEKKEYAGEKFFS